MSDAVAADLVVCSYNNHNVASGIVRTARETMSDSNLELARQSGGIRKLVGDKVDLVLRTWIKSIYLSFRKENDYYKRIVVVSPPLAEKGKFDIWVNKLFNCQRARTRSSYWASGTESNFKQQKTKLTLHIKVCDWSDLWLVEMK